MVNEIFFLIQILLIIGFSVGAARIGPNAMTAYVAMCGVLANLFVVKQMELFGLTVTCSDVFAVGCILGLNLMQEHFGKDAAIKTTTISFIAMVFFVLVSQIHLWYTPSIHDQTHAAFAAILKSTPRIVFASIAVFFLVQKMDVVFFGWLKNRLAGRFPALRMGIALLLSQFVDTILFSFAGLYGIVASLFDVIAVSFIVKCLVIACSAPLASLSRRFIKEPSP